jgi:hypothetical protein
MPRDSLSLRSKDSTVLVPPPKANDHALARDCVRHARMFFGSPDLGLDTAIPGTFVLGPTDDMLADLRRDYERMAGMIIGEVPGFNEVIESIRELEARVNGSPARTG